MYANNQGFLTAIDTTVKYRALVPVFFEKHEEYYQALDIVLRKYNKANFRITRVRCDGEFKPMMDPISDDLDVEMDYTSADEHVPEAERKQSHHQGENACCLPRNYRSGVCHQS